MSNRIENTGQTEPKSNVLASLFDLRSVIGLLFLVYGLVLTVLGIIGETPQELAKSGGIAINLWTGIAMLIGAAIFFLWVWRKPPLPPEPQELEEGGPLHTGHGGHGH